MTFMRKFVAICRPLLSVPLLFTLFAGSLPAQTFDSGSNGSDGALNLTTPGVYLFDPDDVITFGRILDVDRDNIYHFTTIRIGAGVTLRLSSQKLPGPVYWLAQGAAQFDSGAVLDLSGRDGHAPTIIPTHRTYSEAGAGGYPGGPGSIATAAVNYPAKPGLGPGGSASIGFIATNTANQFLLPLIGGSGGAGGPSSPGGGGGGGGGAILIASSVSITVNGTMVARGGNSLGASSSTWGSGGAGGAIRLVAPMIQGNGNLSVGGGSTAGGARAGGSGRIRLEAFQQSFTGVVSGLITFANPLDTFLPAATSSIRVANIAGIPVSSSPNGSFVVPDVTISTTSPVTVAVNAKNVPLGTIVSLHFLSENGPDLIVQTTPLAGQLDQSSATATVTLPTGYSRGLARAAWTQ